MAFNTRWIATSFCFLLVGCGGLERHSYPATPDNILVVGTVELVQPYRGEASESNLSRAGWGTLATGIPGALAGLADSNIGSFDAYSYLIKSSEGQSQLVNSYSLVELGDCVAAYDSARDGISSIEKRPKAECIDH